MPNETYHFYNRSNNRQTIFFEEEDYRKFLKLLSKFVLPHSKIFAYCLMPNHFHFLIFATEESVKLKTLGNIEISELSDGFRITQSSYASYFNKKYNRTGSVFQPKIKAKSLYEGDSNYSFTAFQYIHQNPLRAKLVSRMENWAYSSFPEYLHYTSESLCAVDLAFEILAINRINFEKEAYNTIDDGLIKKIF